MKNIKNEKGSLALFVTIAMLFFMAFLLALFFSTANEQKTQLAVTARIKEIYEKDVNNIDEIYDTFVGKDENIPIYNSEQLKKVGTGESIYISEVGKYYTFNLNSKYILKNNIELNRNKYTVAEDGTITFSSDAEQWTPIGTSANPFTGTFDGNGYQISGLYINNSNDYQGLIKTNNGTIENLTVLGNIKGNSRVGGIVGFNSNNGIIKNCINQCNIIGSEISGGIVGLNRGIITSCENLKGGLISITGKYGAGGIAGRNEKTIENCKNSAYISGTAQIGGIVGNCDAAVDVLVKNCKNFGIVYGNNSVGGIAGGAWRNTNANKLTVHIEECQNNGDITGENYVAGIAGTSKAIVTSCLNQAIVNGVGWTGGIIGWMSDIEASTNNCINEGNVNSSNSTNGIGGIVGWNVGTIENCYNKATITAKQNLGGIAGVSSGDIIKSHNEGIVQHSSDGSWTLGGIAGWVKEGNIKLCYNSGNIIAKNQAGGIIGGSTGNINLENCYNTADFSGISNIGGIVGRCKTESTVITIKNCYNISKISSNDTHVGAILGYDMNGNAKISNCYYLTGTATGGINSTDVKGQAEAKTSEDMKKDTFVTLLNNGENNWKIVAKKNEGYPILNWQD